jgi:hypothetical protein
VKKFLLEFPALYRWVRNPNRAVLDFPPRIFAFLVLLAWWKFWGWTGDIFKGGGMVLGVLAGLGLWVGFLKVYDRFTDLRDEGVEGGFLQLLKNVFSSTNKFGDTDARWEIYVTGPKRPFTNVEPKLYAKKMTSTGEIKAMVNPGKVGGDLARIAADAVTILPGIMDCQEVSVSPVTTGSAWLTFYKKSPLEAPRTVLDLPPSGARSLTFGWLNDGNAATVPFGYNLQISATSNAGKSKFIWNAFFDLLRDNLDPSLPGTPTDMTLIDPKSEFAWFKQWEGKSFANGRIRIVTYIGPEEDEDVEDDEVHNRVLEEAEAHFLKMRHELHRRQARADRMFGPGEELEHPTDEFRAQWTIIDEGLDVAPLFQKGMANTNMGVYMSQGRRTKDFVWMGVQAATVAEIGGIGKAFQMKVSLRQMTAEATKAALGISESDGVPCTSIPFDMPGVGFYVTESGQKAKFRTANVTKVHIRHVMTTGTLPEGMMTRDLARELRNGQRPHYLYRTFGYLKNRKIGHIYTGETNNRERRYKEHRRDDVWKGECPICTVQDCRWWEKHALFTMSCVVAGHDLAVAMEKAEIHALQPMFNIAGAGNNRKVHLTRLTYRGPSMTIDGKVIDDEKPVETKKRHFKASLVEREPYVLTTPTEEQAAATEAKRKRRIVRKKVAPVDKEVASVTPIRKEEPTPSNDVVPEPDGYDLAPTGTDDNFHLTHLVGASRPGGPVQGWGFSE